MDMGDAEEAVSAPGVVGEAIHDLVGVGGANDKENIGSVFERAAEEDKAFVDESVHESGVGLPVVLLFESSRVIPACAAGSSDNEELRHRPLL